MDKYYLIFGIALISALTIVRCSTENTKQYEACVSAAGAASQPINQCDTTLIKISNKK
jgi:ABC-type molybdate transport system substrate-binding protein